MTAITLLSRSSPLYPLNDWGDANCFFTMGKSMLHGRVPYRDLYEQKGPVLYMLHAAAAAISSRTFFGVYLMELAAAFAFLAVSLKILKLYRSQGNLLWIVLLGAVVYSAQAFCQGDSVEEFALPALTWCLYCGLRYLRYGKEISFREGLLIGVTSGCILWSKFTILGFYIGWFAAYAYLGIREKRAKELLKLLGAIALGVAAVSAPVLAYFVYHGAVEDLFTAYFYNNIFLYSQKGNESRLVSLLYNLYSGSLNFSRNNPIAYRMTVLGLIGMLSARKNRECLLLFLTGFGAFFFTFMGTAGFRYYTLIFCAFVPVGMAAVAFWGDRIQDWACARKCRKALVPAAVAACLVFALVKSGNTHLLGTKKEELPQYYFAQIMEQEANPTLLDDTFLDSGYYTVAGIVPSGRYFCRLNIQLEELENAYAQYISEGLTQFVVTRDEKLDSEKYICIAQLPYYYDGQHYMDYLHQLVPEQK